MKEVLADERERRRFYENAYLSKLGAFGESSDVAVNLADFEPVRRYSTLSSLRRQAAEKMKEDKEKEAKATDVIAKGGDLTEAEKIFQEHLNA